MRKWIACVLGGLLLLTQFSFANVNPSKEEIEHIIEQKAIELGIPSVLLKAIARVESNFRQFREDGSTFTGDHGGSIGLMQVNTRSSSAYDRERLRYDIEYNIEAGARVLLGKWQSAVRKLPQIGNMDPNIIENWYFALWAYNGWASSNNPNTGKKSQTYQEMIQKVCKEAYGVEWTLLDPKLLPASGKPDREDYRFDTPEPFHLGDICFYRAGEEVRINSMADLSVRNAPDGEVIGKVMSGEKYVVMGDPVLAGGYYWYPIANSAGQQQGYVAGNYIKSVYGNRGASADFKDILGIPEEASIRALLTNGVIQGEALPQFEPESLITKGALYGMLARSLGLTPMEQAKDMFQDGENLSEEDAGYAAALYLKRYILLDEGRADLDKTITREEFSAIAQRIMEDVFNQNHAQADISQLQVADMIHVAPELQQGVANMIEGGFLNLSEGYFCPKDMLQKRESVHFIHYLYEMTH